MGMPCGARAQGFAGSSVKPDVTEEILERPCQERPRGSSRLREAALAAHAALQARVRDTQKGVLTFFDHFFDGVVRRLTASESLHSWEPERPAPDPQRSAELRWLAGFLAGQSQGRLVPYDVRRQEDRARRPSDIG